MKKIIIDPAHGGCDTKYIYGDRRDKADNLTLANDLQRILNESGVESVLTRTDDVFLPGYERVNVINEMDGDFLFSFSWVAPSFNAGLPRVKFFASEKGGVATQLAENINKNLPTGRYDLIGIELNTELPILKDVDKPALVMEVEYPGRNITNTEFEMISEEMAMAISKGILQTFGTDNNMNEVTGENGIFNENDMNGTNPGNSMDEFDSVNESIDEIDNNTEENDVYYSVQVGLFRIKSNAENLLRELEQKGYEGSIVDRGDFYAVHVGEFTNMDEAVAIEQMLRTQGYNTLLITVE